jgi:hypothetical protein
MSFSFLDLYGQNQEATTLIRGKCPAIGRIKISNFPAYIYIYKCSLFMNSEEILILWLIIAIILLLLLFVATLFCGIALYYRFDNKTPNS